MYRKVLVQGAPADNVVRRDSDGAFVFSDPLSSAWADYLAWLADGNTPTDASVPPVRVPSEVPMWAMQAALQVAGKYAAINQAVSGWATASDPNEVAAYFAWTMGNFAARDSAFIATFASEFGFAPADLDAIFTAANAIANAAG